MPARFMMPFKVPPPPYPGGGYIDPSRYWGEMVGLPSLYECYDDVFRGRHAEIEWQLKVNSDAKLLDRFYRELTARYPAIAEIPASGFYETLKVVGGCASKFPPRDIGYFVSVTDRMRDPSVAEIERDEEDWRKLRILQQVGYSLEWRLSPETMAIMEDRFCLPSWSTAREDFKARMLEVPTSAYHRDEWDW
jgi:hypothetical protein